MKKLTTLLAFTFIIMLSFAQVQRKTAVANKADSAAVATERKPVARGEKKQMIKDLNLNKDQKSKLKEIRQSSKAKKDAIENDEKLSADEKQAKLKELQRAQAKSTMTILNDEQKEKMKKMRKNKKTKQMTEEEN